MSSLSPKELSKEISTSLSSSTIDLPSSLRTLLHDYLEKHPSPDDDSPRLHDELLSIYNTHVASSPPRLAPFFSILFILKPTLAGAGRLLQWWEKLRDDVLDNLQERRLAKEVRSILLRILIWEEDDRSGTNDAILEDKRTTASAIANNLVEIWIAKHRKNLDYPEKYTQFVEDQVRQILYMFGRKRPKDFMVSINSFFMAKETRICALTLLCEYIGQQPPHLYQMLETPLFDNLLKCLRIDTSTRVISLAMTALIMVLPHIPTLISSSKYLPFLFNIYSRMLFWDRNRVVQDEAHSMNEEDNNNEKPEEARYEGVWVKLGVLLESDDETVPELLHYFTFLYGLYPLNFMSYIRKPQKYLRNINFPGADEIEIEPSEIRQRSEPFRRVHALHSNFYNLTIDSELTDTNRWMNSQAADVVAECMELYVNNATIEIHGTRTRGPTEKLSLGSVGPTVQSKHSSWKEHTIRHGDDENRLQRSLSHPAERNMSHLADSPTLPAFNSPPQSPLVESSTPKTILSSFMKSQRSASENVARDSIPSLQLSPPRGHSIDDYLSFRAEKPIEVPNSDVTPGMKLAYLHREIQLLRNDLNFEQFLKAQHLSHIGQLRQKQLRDARVEAETQNLINSHRKLRADYEETKARIIQIRTENEKAKLNARKWETDLSNRLRLLKNDQKKWTIEKEELSRDLHISRSANLELKAMVVKSERKELNSRQKLMTLQASIEELAQLKAENERLSRALLQYEMEERTAVKATAGEEKALQETLKWKSLYRAKENELYSTKQAFDRELYVAQTSQDTVMAPPPIFEDLIATAKKRTLEVQQAHHRLQAKYNDALQQIMQLKADNGHIVYDDDFELPLHSPSLRSPTARLSTRRSTATDQSWDKIQAPSAIDTSGPSVRSPGSAGTSGVGMSHLIGSEPFMDSLTRRGSTKEMAKVKPQSEMRVYGRGGVQNIGKKEKGKEGDGKEGKKKEKSSMGIRGIRGFN